MIKNDICLRGGSKQNGLVLRKQFTKKHMHAPNV